MTTNVLKCLYYISKIYHVFVIVLCNPLTHKTLAYIYSIFLYVFGQ